MTKRTDKADDDGEIPPSPGPASPPPPPLQASDASPPSPRDNDGAEAEEQTRGRITISKVRGKDQYLALDENDDQLAIIRKRENRGWAVRLLDFPNVLPDLFSSAPSASAYVFGFFDGREARDDE